MNRNDKEKLMRKPTSIYLCFLLIFAIHLAKASDWPRWRGPAGDGISRETAWNPRALDSQPRILWETNVGKGHSTVVTQGDFLVTMGNRMVPSSKDTAFEDIVFCLNAKTGLERWRFTYPCQEGRDYCGPASTPLIHESSVYTLSREGHLYCLDLQDGFVNWYRNIFADSLTQGHMWGTSASPVVDGDLLIINGGESGLAFNKNTGAVVWKSESAECGFATPVILDVDGQRKVAIQAEKHLHLVDLKTGAVEWSYPWTALNDPIFLGSRILLTAGREGRKKGCMMLERNGDSEKIVWHHRKQDVAFQNWVVIDRHAYGIFRNRKQHLRCVDLETGEITWDMNLGMWGSFTAANNKLIVITGEGEIIIAEARPDAFHAISRAKVIRTLDTTDLPHHKQCYVWTNPVLSEGKLYTRSTFGDLVCVDLTR